MKYLTVEAGHIESLASPPGQPELVHVFEKEVIAAINAALAAGRPLLVRGEPGIGKSQLARAARKCLRRAYIPHVVDARTESRDLLWHFDAVERLAEAQLLGALGDKSDAVRDRLAVENFLRPGPLWWAFDWRDAKKVASPPLQRDSGRADNGCVVLVDEIDKAETDVPNGLLEALGSGEFTPLGRSGPVVAKGIPPLVVITTNEERALPDAFIRRCLVLFLRLPTDKHELIDKLVARGRSHFLPKEADDTVLKAAAEQLAKDREKAKAEHFRPLPGQAEYLDLVRAIVKLRPGNPKEQEALLQEIAHYTLQKHIGAN